MFWRVDRTTRARRQVCARTKIDQRREAVVNRLFNFVLKLKLNEENYLDKCWTLRKENNLTHKGSFEYYSIREKIQEYFVWVFLDLFENKICWKENQCRPNVEFDQNLRCARRFRCWSVWLPSFRRIWINRVFFNVSSAVSARSIAWKSFDFGSRVDIFNCLWISSSSCKMIFIRSLIMPSSRTFARDAFKRLCSRASFENSCWRLFILE